MPVLLAMATGFMMLKQTAKARNQLKRVQKVKRTPPLFAFLLWEKRGECLRGENLLSSSLSSLPFHVDNMPHRCTLNRPPSALFQISYKPDEAEEFERSWLLLADIHIQVRVQE